MSVCLLCVFFWFVLLHLEWLFLFFYFFVLCVFEVERVMGGVGVAVLYLDT